MEWTSPIKPPFGTPINRNHWASAGLCAQYLFNEGCGDLVHDSCGNNDGKMIGMAPMSGTSGWVPGPHGAALAFDGSNDYVDCGTLRKMSHITVGCSLTLNTITSSVGQKFIFIGVDASTNWHCFLGMAAVPAPYWEGGVSNGSSWQPVTSTTVAQIKVKAFLVLTYNTNTAILYLNAIPIASIDTSVIMSEFKIYIGASGSIGQPPNAIINNSFIYNRALQPDEIAYLNAFPWCMYDMPASAWEYDRQSRKLDRYYRRLAAA